MRITIETSGTAGTELDTDRELHRAFNVLHNALIQTRGGGRFADGSAAIILASETDAPGGARCAEAGRNTSAGVLV
jgi:hypothetical protein